MKHLLLPIFYFFYLPFSAAANVPFQGEWYGHINKPSYRDSFGNLRPARSLPLYISVIGEEVYMVTYSFDGYWPNMKTFKISEEGSLNVYRKNGELYTSNGKCTSDGCEYIFENDQRGFFHENIWKYNVVNGKLHYSFLQRTLKKDTNTISSKEEDRAVLDTEAVFPFK